MVFFKDLFCILERERVLGKRRQKEKKRESQAGLSAEPDMRAQYHDPDITTCAKSQTPN